MKRRAASRIFIRVIFPLMKNALVLNTLLSIIDGFKVLGPMQLVTDGGPANSTQSAMLLIYKSVFNAPARIGRAAPMPLCCSSSS